MQVVTNENIMQLHETGKVDAFKAPDAVEAPKETVAFKKADGSEVKFEKSAAEKAAEQVEADKTEAAKPQVDEDDEDADLPERVKRQIGKKHRAMKEAEEFGRDSYLKRLAAEERAEKLERELQSMKSGPVKDSAEPKPEDFKTNAEYIDAVVEYRFQQKEASEQQKRIEAAQNQRQAEFIDRLNAVRKEIPDFDEVCESADYEVVPHVASYIAESDLGPKLGYHFAKHPDELERIQKLSPIRAIAELGKLETKLEKPAEAAAEKVVNKPVKVSGAPSPIATLDASAKAVVTKDPAKMSFTELREYERQKQAERAKR